MSEILKLFLQIEKSVQSKHSNFNFFEEELKNLKEKIQSLTLSPDPQVQHLAATEKHLVPSMTLRHFTGFAVPFERALARSLQDSDFLVIENDKTHPSQVTLPLVFVLDNLRSAFNVGSIFRTAECIGAEKIYLCGYTPSPSQEGVQKTAMGTQQYLPWEESPRLEDCLQQLKSQGYHLVALETTQRATGLYQTFAKRPTALILGNERFGLSAEILKSIDETRIIPLRGRKNSLNVGVTAAIAGFEWVRQWELQSSR